MARLFIDGFESGGLDQLTSQSGCTVVGTSGLDMDGSYCLECNGGTDYATVAMSAVSELYLAFRYRPTSAGLSQNTCLVSFWKGGTFLGHVRHDATTEILSSTWASSSVTVPASSTSHIEVYYKIADSGGRLVVKINGITAIDFTGDTKPGADTTFDSVRFGYNAQSTTGYGYAYYDNIIIDSTSWIGKTYIQGLAPTGAGNSTQFTASTGSNYQCVDEVPASDTDYNYTNTNNNIDTFACADLSGTIGTIKAVQVQARAVKEGAATPQNLQLVVRRSSTDYVSSSVALPTTAATLAGIWETDPSTSAAWGSSGVNAMEIGYKAVA